jgi:hypothetical protein
MTTPRRTLIALAIAIAVAAATAAIAVGGGTAGPPKQAIVTSHGLRTGTDVGSYCTGGTTKDGTAVSGCGYGYPGTPRSYLPVTPGGTVRANVRKRAKSAGAYLIHLEDQEIDRVGGDVTATPAKGTHRRVWRLHLPDDLGGANVLAIEAEFANGDDGSWFAGVNPVTHWP